MDYEIPFDYIYDIAETVNDFRLYVLETDKYDDGTPWETLLFNAAQRGEYTLQPDGTVDIDYCRMCFTLSKNDQGKAKMETGTYYPDGCLDGDGVPDEIDITF